MMKALILGLALWWLLGGAYFGLAGKGRWSFLDGRGRAAGVRSSTGSSSPRFS